MEVGETALHLSRSLKVLLQEGQTSPELLIAALQSRMLSRTARWILAHVRIYTSKPKVRGRAGQSSVASRHEHLGRKSLAAARLPML